MGVIGSKSSKSSRGSKGCVRLGSVLSVLLLCANAAAAQSFEGGLHLAASQWSEFDGTDLGIGGRITWTPTSLIGVDADLTWYPSDFPDQIAFSGSRVEGLFGVTVGPRLNRVRPFAKAAAGFLRSSEAPEPFPCIAIFPPPLNCLMAAGHTMPVFEIGGGVQITTTQATFLRVDVADRIVEYPGPTFGPNFELRDDAYFGHALRVTVGFAYRFQ
jgi:hypothetical protein